MGVPADMRYAILINEFSASASELFTGCLRDLDLAEIIGHPVPMAKDPAR